MKYLIKIGLILLCICQFACPPRGADNYPTQNPTVPGGDVGYYVVTENGQVVDLVVTDSSLYHQETETGNRLIIGGQLFSYLCSNCHPHNKLSDTARFYERTFDLDQKLLHGSMNHGRWPDTVLQRLDSFDVAAIQYFIDKYKRNESRY